MAVDSGQQKELTTGMLGGTFTDIAAEKMGWLLNPKVMNFATENRAVELRQSAEQEGLLQRDVEATNWKVEAQRDLVNIRGNHAELWNAMWEMYRQRYLLTKMAGGVEKEAVLMVAVVEEMAAMGNPGVARTSEQRGQAITGVVARNGLNGLVEDRLVKVWRAVDVLGNYVANHQNEVYFSRSGAIRVRGQS
jgi:hypothetical protein